MEYTETRTPIVEFSDNNINTTEKISEQKNIEINQKIKQQKKEIENTIFNTQNLDMVQHPNHYGAGNGLQCIEAMLQTFGKYTLMSFCKLNAFKYIWRSDHKGKDQKERNVIRHFRHDPVFCVYPVCGLRHQRCQGICARLQTAMHSSSDRRSNSGTCELCFRRNIFVSTLTNPRSFGSIGRSSFFHDLISNR